MVEEEEEKTSPVEERETEAKSYLLHRETIRSGKRHQERERERESTCTVQSMYKREDKRWS